MIKQLTIDLNEETVNRAEHISKKQGKSISQVIEELIKSIPEEESENPVDKIRKLMAPYIGRLNLPQNLNYKETIARWRYEDYINKSND